MKQLKKDFIGRGQVRGFKFSQIKKSEYAYLYKVDTGDSILYEIFEHKENTHFNNVSYPSNKAFGLWAYTTSDYNRAIDLFQEVEETVINRVNS